jgi:hypothetical protein
VRPKSEFGRGEPHVHVPTSQRKVLSESVCLLLKTSVLPFIPSLFLFPMVFDCDESLNLNCVYGYLKFLIVDVRQRPFQGPDQHKNSHSLAVQVADVPVVRATNLL